MLNNKLVLSALVASTLSINAFANEYSQGEIYQVMCKKCHGSFAEGNPAKKGPNLRNLTEAELAVDIFELDGDGYQSSGSAHEQMETNLKVIRRKGMNVDADKMAKYIFTSFGVNN
jgi:cytochrome c2